MMQEQAITSLNYKITSQEGKFRFNTPKRISLTGISAFRKQHDTGLRFPSHLSYTSTSISSKFRFRNETRGGNNSLLFFNKLVEFAFTTLCFWEILKKVYDRPRMTS
ncbi:hypothetical protein TWF225_003990 [Orbilia oligospora]|nr:hypothetical protein TWF751_010258 [Orbilia oligospora]KAF3187751.1 hypothetical protein TWF225_003990 [Orbilia oligospora]KAF3248408.1 hypothetical protein TWF128_008395 [Orbilia oligospora]KAF3256887.1 hypothetical protein TWF217_006204 [Orbilia oligospora]KAF3294063.1 hypothetical protein TWF132_003936 [Orbilia oligospora]